MKRRPNVYTKRMMVRFDPSERRALERAAAREHRPVAQLVRAITLRWLENVSEPQREQSAT